MEPSYEEIMFRYCEDLLKTRRRELIKSVITKAIDELEKYDRKSNMMQSGEDSCLENLWEEICAQIQYEEGIFFEYTLDFARDVIDGILSKDYTTEELRIMWLNSEGIVDYVFNWIEDTSEDKEKEISFPEKAEYMTGLSESLLDDLMSIAADYESDSLYRYLNPDADEYDEDDDDDDDE